MKRRASCFLWPARRSARRRPAATLYLGRNKIDAKGALALSRLSEAPALETLRPGRCAVLWACMEQMGWATLDFGGQGWGSDTGRCWCFPEDSTTSFRCMRHCFPRISLVVSFGAFSNFFLYQFLCQFWINLGCFWNHVKPFLAFFLLPSTVFVT